MDYYSDGPCAHPPVTPKKNHELRGAFASLRVRAAVCKSRSVAAAASASSCVLQSRSVGALPCAVRGRVHVGAAAAARYEATRRRLNGRRRKRRAVASNMPRHQCAEWNPKLARRRRAALSADMRVCRAADDTALEHASEGDACRGCVSTPRPSRKVLSTRRIACTGGTHTQEAVCACSRPIRLTRRQRSDSATTWTTIGTSTLSCSVVSVVSAFPRPVHGAEGDARCTYTTRLRARCWLIMEGAARAFGGSSG